MVSGSLGGRLANSAGSTGLGGLANAGGWRGGDGFQFPRGFSDQASKITVELVSI